MIFGLGILATALLLSVVAAYYSVAGLTAIFSAATIPVIIMGASLELGKIVATVWLHNNWRRAGIVFKLYLIPAVAFLMLLTSMGIFGYLSKAHSDQSLVSGDSMARVAIYDEKIKISRENIDANRKALRQMDEAVDQVMARSSDEKGADKAVALRRGQQRERARLLLEIEGEQKKITALNEERAPLAAEFRKIEADVGPIKYIAALVYGDNTDSTVLERAVRLVIIMIVLVFDPLALTLILAANKQFEWVRAGAGAWHRPAYEPDDGPLTPEQVQHIQDSAPQPVTVDEDEVAQGRSKAAMIAWKLDHPDDTWKHQRALLHQGKIDRLPWDQPPYTTSELGLEPDHVPGAGTVQGFGSAFPETAQKGDMFVRLDYLPSRLFKYNGSKWVEVDKKLTDQYSYQQGYIDWLIQQLDAGTYDAEWLTDSERDEIAQRLAK